jgi:hypothetical protein
VLDLLGGYVAISNAISGLLGIDVRDEIYYAAALREFESGTRRDGLWAIAMIRSDGDDSKVRGIYLGLLAKALKDEEQMRDTATLLEEPAPRPAVQPPPPLPADQAGAGWHYIDNSHSVVGPISKTQMASLANRLPASTLVHPPNAGQWTSLLNARNLI